MRYLIKFSYDGSCFNGYQRQKNLKTVQGVIEKYLTSLNNNKMVNIFSSGRTDKGVHAICQFAHFDLDVDVKLYNLKKYLNKSFDGEIFVSNIYIVNDKLHARYDVVNKTYSYYINMGEFTPIQRNYVLQYCKNLNVEKMLDASKVFLGEHDFRSFCYDQKHQKNCVRNIFDVNIEVKNCILKITFTGNGFLRKMVRNMVSILIKIGEEKIEKEDLIYILSCQKKSYNVNCVSACGLYLDNVFYGDDFNE